MLCGKLNAPATPAQGMIITLNEEVKSNHELELGHRTLLINEIEEPRHAICICRNSWLIRLITC